MVMEFPYSTGILAGHFCWHLFNLPVIVEITAGRYRVPQRSAEEDPF